ncbi:MAG TPA: phage portal protein [Phycisphaerae bacterium]|nr:phage portal protein [Phycisphaerae bacterium]
MQIFGFTIQRTKALPPQLQLVDQSRGGWWPIIREPYTGAWQTGAEQSADTVLTYSALYGCVTLIASDVAKCRPKLVRLDEDGIWSETSSTAFSPVIRKPNHFQNRIQFYQWWMSSKLLHGNTYVLKRRDARGVVVALHILDPTRVTVLVSPDGSVFYQLAVDNLAGLGETVTVPAREMIHDVMTPLFHPLIGVTPIYACGMAAYQGIKIQTNSTKFFAQGSQPGGILVAPGAISDTTAQALKLYWETNFSGDNIGKVAVLGDGLKYEPMTVKAVDAQLIEQLKWTGLDVCTAFHVPAYMVGVGSQPTYANAEPLNQQYYSQCLQVHFESLELALDEGLELPAPYGTEFDLEDLIRMDGANKMKMATDGVGGGVLTVNEARAKFDLRPVAGGTTPYLQQQYYSLEALNRRDLAAAAPPTPAVPEPPDPDEPDADDADEPDRDESPKPPEKAVDVAEFSVALLAKMIEGAHVD